MALRILLGDDHKLTLDGIVRTLDEESDMEVVATAHSGTEVMRLVAEVNPELALLDIRMPGLDGLACLDQIRERHPDVKVVMLSSFTDRHHINAAFRRGASAYIVKSVNPTELACALRHAFDGNVFHAPVEPGASGSTESLDLTAREQTMLEALSRGLSNKAISKELWVTEQTVKFHLNNVYRKLGVESRTAAVRFAYDHGLVDAEPALA
jgi:DNA-binding NarL/FixJ family response regulator